MKPYYQDEFYTQYAIDCLIGMKELPDNSVDLLCTDPPYGLSFMGKDWDKAVPSVAIWKECLRLLKPGAFAFIMCTPRQDCLSRMIVNLQDAGFRTDFTSIFWSYASGFPKAENIGKMVDKTLGVEREVVGFQNYTSQDIRNNAYDSDNAKERERLQVPITQPSSIQAKALDGSYGGFQPKPAVEVIIVAMKPLSEKTFVAQALENGKGITWLDDTRIPFQSDNDKNSAKPGSLTVNPEKRNPITGEAKSGGLLAEATLNKLKDTWQQPLARFPANLLVCDDVLNDGNITATNGLRLNKNGILNTGASYGSGIRKNDWIGKDDSGSFSRYFDLDKWWEEKVKSLPESVQKTFPFLICPKASKGEKNIGCEELEEKPTVRNANTFKDGLEWNIDPRSPDGGYEVKHDTKMRNIHPTVKPLKLISYLITLGSRPNEVVLDNFIGSGTTARACKILNRKCIGFEIDIEQYAEIASHRQNKVQLGLLND